MFIRQTIFSLTLGVCIPLLSATPQDRTPAQRLVQLILQRKSDEAEQLCQQPRLQNMSQSDAYAYAHYATIAQYLRKNSTHTEFVDLSDANVVRCILDAYAKEVTENADNRCVFFDTPQWQQEWWSSLYKALYEATTGTTVPANYQFLRFKDPLSLQKTDDDLYQKLKTQQSYPNQLQKYYIFMYPELFTTAYDWARPSMYYDTSRTTTRKLFSRCGIRKIYKQYKQELDQLQQEHQQLTQRSCLRVISLSPQYCQDHVIVYHFDWTAGNTGSALANVTLLRSNPYKALKNDMLRYGLILTRNKTLAPSDQVRVWIFSDVEPAKWAIFCKKRDALFERIKKDIRQLKKSAQSVQQK